MSHSLFALTSNPAHRIVKFSLTEEIQNELTEYLRVKERGFLTGPVEEIVFDGKYKPDGHEILLIQNYDDIDNLSDAIRNPLGYPEISPMPEVFCTIKALFSGYADEAGEITVLIQHFDKRKIISTNGFSIFHSKEVYKRIEGIGLTIDSKISATLKGKELRFSSFHLVRQIFDLSEYYLEATDSDITDFASLPAVKVDNIDHLIAVSDHWVRRKFALIQQSEILESVPIHEIRAVAIEFSISLKTVTEDGVEKICLPTIKADLKTLLRFLDEDYYKSPLSQTYYMTNSKRLHSPY
ncbi:Kiwa anti-phage protein KwaB-like domain-containing protein [Nitrosospira sp. Is2]|uniref:Kiwa anti-phage protein KwaB-like domain-containing protein n=1 Tax=Nitrosospira sp. Is2 TaxID=3080532 RepID=UPI002954D7DC|nr:Kiwa anti-phage protein KwaB-like domain-containing protein [Nitrosospira sp. Is2]WON74175.1 DUF4868 domain-containing protein [Nitrosospira sp. Is2]